MPYATIDELKARTDTNILRQLSDDNDYGITIESILTDALESGSDYADNVVPEFLSDETLLKEIELLKAQELLFRRKGYLEAAKSNMEQITALLNQVTDKYRESTYPERNRTPQYHTTSGIDVGDWEDWFSDS